MPGIPTISVIIPLYNKAAYVGRAVESALSQTISPLEVLVIDDGSTDDGPARLEAYMDDPRVRIIRQPNRGEGAARNRGLVRMRGDIAAFLDADDEWLPGHVEAISELARQFPEAGLLATGYRTQYRGDLAVETTISEGVSTLIRNYFDIARGTYPMHISSAAIRRDVACGSGGFLTGEPWGADLEFFGRVALERPIAYHPAITGIYYAHVPGSAMNVFRWNNRIPPVVRSLQPRLEKIGADIRPSVERYIAWVLAQHAIQGLCAGERSEALRVLAQFRPHHPGAARHLRLRRLAARWTPAAVARPFLRLQRSRYAVRSRNGVVNRVVHVAEGRSKTASRTAREVAA